MQQKLISLIRDVKDFPKAGILFKDITPVLKEPAVCRQIVSAFFKKFSNTKIDAIVGIESRGFLFGMMLAQKFKIPFVPVRKSGKLPYKTVSYKYDLEYGSAEVEIHADAIRKGQRVLLHDDLLATGGTAAASAELVRMLGGKIAGFSFLIELAFLNGRKKLEKYSGKIECLLKY